MVKNLDSAGKFLMYPRFVQVILDKQVGDMSTHDEIYVTPSHTKKDFANMKMQGKGFSRVVTPLFPTMMVQAQKEIEPVADEAVYKEKGDSLERATTTASSLDAEQDRGNIAKTHSKATPNESSSIGTSSVNTKTAQAQEITILKLRVKKLEKKGRSRAHKLKRLYKVGLSARVVSSDEEGLGNQEDASKQGRKSHDIDADEDIILDSTHFDTNPDMFRVNDIIGDEVVVESEVAVKKKDDEVVVEHMDASAGDKVFVVEQREKVVEKVVTTAEVSAATITEDEMTLAQALAEMKGATKVTTATIATTKGILLQEPSETRTTTTTTTIPLKDKGKAIMVE
ncbi:hypothetical protein Tco_1352871 [Tanacetum coccineum]